MNGRRCPSRFRLRRWANELRERGNFLPSHPIDGDVTHYGDTEAEALVAALEAAP